MDQRERRHARYVLAALTAATAIAALPAGAAAQNDERLKVPIVLIDAPQEIVDEPKRTATMRVFDTQRHEDYNGHVGIELRGFGSQKHPKKSYGFETRELSGKDRNVSLLGMPKDEDWVLIANYRDESLLRNHVAYAASRWLGRYAARTQFVEVVVNGTYEGVYLLAEDLKLTDSRVAVDDTDVSGGYVLEMVTTERTRGKRFFTTPVKHQPVVYKDPNSKEISYGRAAWIRDYVGRCERRLYGNRFTDPRRGYRHCLDMDAAVDYLLLNELFRNAAVFWFSTYMHKGVRGKLVLGPIWDFDLSIGNSDAVTPNQRVGWQYDASPWAERLYADPAFRRRMATRWQELRKRGIQHYLTRTIERGVTQLTGGPQERNFSRWPTFERGKNRGPRDPRTGRLPANHGEAVGYLKWWIAERIRWIDEQMNTLA